MKDRKKILIFSSGLKHSAMIAEAIRLHDPSVATVDGTMELSKRDYVLNSFRASQFRYLVNANILTTGYDEPGIDGIVMLRPTRSPGLLLQCAGRGLRKSEDKENCLFLDYGGCLQHFGPLDTIEENIVAKRKKGPPRPAPTKVCDCGTVLAASAIKCPTCGKEFPRSLKHEEEAADAPVMSNEPHTHQIASMRASIYTPSGKLPTLRLDYCDHLGIPSASEWLSISPDANPYAVNKSLKLLANWPKSPFRLMGDTLYFMKDGALAMCNIDHVIAQANQLEPPLSVITVKNGKYHNITKRNFA